MGAEPRTIALTVERDARLAAGAGGIAHYLADAAGMASEACSQLQAATIAACLQAFAALTPERPLLQVRYVLYADRIEIELTDAGQSVPVTIQRFTKHFGKTTANT